jgi:hypothetical protein
MDDSTRRRAEPLVEEALARLTSAGRVVRRLLQHADPSTWRLALDQAVRDAETAAQALDLCRKMTEEN